MIRITGLLGLFAAFIVGAFSPVQGQGFLTNGLVAYYPLDGNANDASGNGNNGMASGVTLTTDRFGHPNRAYNFDGISAEIVVTNAGSGWPGGSSPRTVSVWLLSAQGNGNLFTMGQKVNSGDFCIEWPAPGGPVCFVGWQNDYCFEFPGASGWIQLAITYDGTNGIIYINGAESGSFQKTLNTVGTAPLFIGADLDSVARGGGFFSGQLDDVRIYSRALSASEAAQLFAFESPPILSIRKAVYLSSANLRVGTNYQVQVSTDLSAWTNYGAPFNATNAIWRSTNYWDVDDWGSLFFRLQSPP